MATIGPSSRASSALSGYRPPIFQDLEMEAEEAFELGPDTRGQKIKPLTEQEVAGILHAEIYDSLGDLDSEIAEQRRESLSYYLGKPFGNEQEGQSSVVMLDVLETVEWMLPGLLRMFFGGQHVARYVPRIPAGANEAQIQQATERAEQATAYINHLFLNTLRGFKLFHDWFKDALIEKNGILKSYAETRYEPRKATYHGLSEEELMLLLGSGDVEPIAFQERPPEIVMQPDGQRVVVRSYDIEVRQVKSETRIKIDSVPPEEFLIARRAVTLDDDTPFLCHRKKTTVSELIALGYDRDFVLSLPSDDTPEWSLERTERFEEDETYPYAAAYRTDPASRMLWVNECFLRIDEDGDGYSELRKILCVGDSSITIVDDMEVHAQPFSSVTPIPMPHKFFGLSLSDIVRDIQLIRSTILRQLLDNTYLQTNQRTIVTPDVEIEDLLVARAGGLIRADRTDALAPYVTPQLPPDAYHLFDRFQDIRENRTGITRYNQGLDASALSNQTALGVDRMMTAAAARIELVARIFAETGVKDLFRKLLRLVVESGVKAEAIRFRGAWAAMDPSQWDAEMDVEIELGLGVGQAQERMAFLRGILEVQEKMAGFPGMSELMTPPAKIYEAVAEMTRTMGFSPERFFQDPGNRPLPERGPDPKMVELQQEAQQEAAKLEVERLKAETDARRIEQMHQRESAELALNRELKIMEIQSRERIELARIGAMMKERDEAEEAEETAA